MRHFVRFSRICGEKSVNNPGITQSWLIVLLLNLALVMHYSVKETFVVIGKQPTFAPS